MAAFARFCATQGLDDPPLSHPLVEAFCAQGLPGRTEATAGSYRSVLRRSLGAVPPVGRPRYRGAGAKAPYSPVERAELVSICQAQPKAWRGEAALVVLAAGIGAGLRSGELVAARGGDVGVDSEGVTVSVTGERARTVVVAAPFGEALWAAARRVGKDHLVHPGPASRRYHNFLNALLANLVADPGAPGLSVARCRASYVCDRLGEGVPLSWILRATGIGEVESLLRYAHFVEGAPHTKAGLRRAHNRGR